MYELTFFNKNNFLSSNFYDKKMNQFKALDKNESLELINGLSEEANKITNICFTGEDLSFMIGNIKVVLKGRKNFIDEENFDFVFEKIKNNRYKVVKQVVKAAMVTALAGAISFASLVTINAYASKEPMQDIEKQVTTSYYTDLDLENEKVNDLSLLETDDVIVESIDKEVSTEISKSDDIQSKESLAITESLSLGSMNDSDKLLFVKENYGDIIEKYSKMYGLDSDLICAIATQERGVHSNTVDEGGAIGLMQVQVAVWNGSKVRTFNYETGEYETIKVTLDDLKDVDFNIKTGCAIFQNYLKQMQGNIVAATQTYNMGPGTMKKILSNYSSSSGKTIDEILNDIDDLSWMDYRNSSYAGDPDYIEHVFRYYANDNLNELQTGIKK